MIKFYLPILISVLCVLLSERSQAQQAPQYSLPMLNAAQFNPGAAGTGASLSLTAVFRKQWVDLTGSPSQQYINAQMPLYFISSGIGISIENDVLGARRYTTTTLQYNYQQPVGQMGILSLGLSAAMVQFSLDGTQIRTPEGTYTDNTFDHRDALLPLGTVSAATPSIGLGIYYQDEKFKAGLSASNILEPKTQVGAGYFFLNRHYFLYSAYKMRINSTFSLQPALLVKSDIRELQAELSIIVDYDGNIFGGAGLRGYSQNTLESAVIIAGWHASPRATLAYAYDLSLFSLKDVQAGSHEIVLRYTFEQAFGKGKLPKVIYNPRFL